MTKFDLIAVDEVEQIPELPASFFSTLFIEALSDHSEIVMYCEVRESTDSKMETQTPPSQLFGRCIN